VAAGVVYSPVNNEMFWAEKGAGAYVNDKRLRVSARRELKDAVFATGVPFAATTGADRLAFARTLTSLMPQIAGIRRFGSAALDLCWTAAGRYDGYWEFGIHPWDIAAGMLIVREAGGFATDAAGAQTLGRTVVAANPHLHPNLRELVAEGLLTKK
jgi:myo-inositol-1(or 4)-monophosphatase